MAKDKTVSNEEVVAALMSSATKKEAATKCGLSERSVYDRMQERDFIEMYNTAKSEMLRAVIVELNKHTLNAVKTIAEIMNDKETNNATRLQAAQTILNNNGKFTEQLNGIEKENAQYNNPLWFW